MSRVLFLRTGLGVKAFRASGLGIPEAFQGFFFFFLGGGVVLYIRLFGV